METDIGNILVIYGPPASGKTTNAQRLKLAFGRARIVDDWAPRVRSHAKSRVQPGDLVLTNELPKVIAHHLPNARILSIEEALRSIKVRTRHGHSMSLQEYGQHFVSRDAMRADPVPISMGGGVITDDQEHF